MWLKKDNSALAILTTKSEGTYASVESKSGFDDTVDSVPGLNDDYLKRGDAFLGRYILVYMYISSYTCIYIFNYAPKLSQEHGKRP